MGTLRTSATREQIVQYFSGKAWRQESKGDEFSAENPNCVVTLKPAGREYDVKVWAKEDPDGPDSDSGRVGDPAKFLKDHIEGPLRMASAPAARDLVRAVLRRSRRGSAVRTASVGAEAPDWAKKLESVLRRDGWSSEMDGEALRTQLEEFEATVEPLGQLWEYEYRLNWTDEKSVSGTTSDPISEYVKFQRDTVKLVQQHAEDEFGWGDLD